MKRADIAWHAASVAAGVIRERGLTTLPIDPLALAGSLGIEVRAKAVSGVSGMLLRAGNNFGIVYSTHISSRGFQNFSVAHELGHYFLPGHIDAVFRDGDVHHSHAGFSSGDRFELEADHFASALLMPEALFTEAAGRAGEGLVAIEKLSDLCVTSLTATAIRYTQCTDEAVAIVMSAGKKIDYCFMSKTLEEVAGRNRIGKGEAIPPGTPTSDFNKDGDRVLRSERTMGTSDLQDWIGGRHSIELCEEVFGLGTYGKTLTVLTATAAVDAEELKEDKEMTESWTPRFRR